MSQPRITFQLGRNVTSKGHLNKLIIGHQMGVYENKLKQIKSVLALGSSRKDWQGQKQSKK